MRAMATKDKRTEQLFSLIRNGAQLNVWDQIELVWRLSLPAIFAQISFVMVQYIDAAMVGHLGANPAASIGLVSSSLWLVWGLITSVTAGFTVQVAQRIGTICTPAVIVCRRSYQHSNCYCRRCSCPLCSDMARRRPRALCRC